MHPYSVKRQSSILATKIQRFRGETGFCNQLKLNTCSNVHHTRIEPKKIFLFAMPESQGEHFAKVCNKYGGRYSSTMHICLRNELKQFIYLKSIMCDLSLAAKDVKNNLSFPVHMRIAFGITNAVFSLVIAVT